MITEEAVQRARQNLSAGNPVESVRLLVSVAEQAHLVDRDYDDAMYLLAQALSQANLLRAAATVLLYLGRAEDMIRVAAGTQPTDLARAYLCGPRPQPREAAKHYRTAGWPAHSAIAYERAEDFASARAMWEEVMADGRLRKDPYVAALVSFNLGRVLKRLGEDTQAHRCRVRAMRLLEEAADVLETRGLRDRAFDCFQVLLTLGIETGSFENLAEGYVNCVRILREDHLKHYALQYYEDFIKKAEAAGEHHASATMLHEAANYARAVGLNFHGTLRVREAQAWEKAGASILSSGGAGELAENAYLAAIGAYSNAGMHGSAVATFRTLSTIGLEEARTKRYARLAERYSDARNEGGASVRLPDYLQQPVKYPDIWNDDVIEWEASGDPIETCGEILLDTALPSFIRRRALVARLWPLTHSAPQHPTALATLAEKLGQIQVYQTLSPLEQLYEHTAPTVRASVLRASQMLFFKRTFVMINRGVMDPDTAVRANARDAVARLHFPHAFDPLSRLHRDSVDPEIRRAALGSIGKVQTIEAIEYLIGVLSHGTNDDRRMAYDLLSRSDFPDTGRALASAIERETGEMQRVLQQIRAARGDR
ncbi:MAG: HEAT repeat domain-containing protein [Deltaproteobacteria bacterium]|nr:HEAT repeat domain-containing protein [Deltaproteobacteria bacterium]